VYVVVVQAGEQDPAGCLYDLFAGFRPQAWPAFGDQAGRQAHVTARDVGQRCCGGQVGTRRPQARVAD